MKRILIPLVLVVGLLLFGLSAFVVGEGEQVIITQFGKPVGEPITSAGLHFKTPFIQDVRRFEKRILQWDGAAEQIVTSENKYLYIDTIARWRIVDPLLFLQRVRDETGARSRLDDILDGAVRDAVTNHQLIDVVRSSNREMVLDIADATGIGEELEFENVSTGREQLAQGILAEASSEVTALGIELMDVRFKRSTYVDSVLQQVYQRMITERERIAARYRSEGRAEQAKIMGELQRDLKKIESEAFREAEEIRGRADAESTRIYAEAYSKDQEFYSFLKTLETYRLALNQGDVTLLMSSQSDLFRLLKSDGTLSE